MKKIFYSILAAAAILTGCNREVIILDSSLAGTGAGKGTLMLDLNFDDEYTEIVTRAAQTDEELLNGLVLDIYRPADKYAHPSITYKEVKDKGGIVELGSGSYELKVSSPVKKDVAFDQPIYEAKKNFEIKIGEITNIGTLTCKIQNVKVSLELSENFMNELASFDITVSNGKGNLMWSKNSEYDIVTADSKKAYKARQAGFFSVADLTVTVSGKRASDGSAATKSYKVSPVKAADHHVLKLDAKVTGNLGLDIKIDNNTNNTDQDVIVPGFEDKPVEGNKPGEDQGGNTGGNDTPSSTAPTLSWPANPTFADMNLPMTTSAVVSVDLEINAPEGIKEFLIHVNSKVLSPTIAKLTDKGEAGMVNGVATMDMINDETLYSSLGASGKLPMKDKVLNQTSVPFSLSALVPLINMYAEDITPGDRHTFSLYVVDNDNQVLEQDVTFVSVAVE